MKDNKKYPLSDVQKRLYSQAVTDNTGVLYNLSFMLEIKCPIDQSLFWKTINKLTNRHEALRAKFLDEEGNISYVINKKVKVAEEAKRIRANNISREIKKFIRPFDLSKPPLFRIKLLQISNDHYFLLIDIHHLICDLRTHDMLIEEALKIYRGKTIDTHPGDYSEYINNLAKYHKNQDYVRAENYWQNKIKKNDLVKVNLLYDYSGDEGDYSGHSLVKKFPTPLVKKINILKNELGVSTYSILYAAYLILLQKLTGQKEIATTIALSGRTDKKFFNTAGMFVNILPVFCNIAKSCSVKEFIYSLAKELKAVSSNQNYDFFQLLAKSGSKRDKLKEIAKIGFNGRNHVHYPNITLQYLTQPAIYHLLFEYDKFGEDIILQVAYRTSLFDKQHIIKWMNYYFNIVNAIAENPNCEIRNINILTKDEYQKITYAWNETETFPFTETLITKSLLQQVRKNPSTIAITDGQQSLTYQELHKLTNQLSNYLLKLKVKKGDTVGVGLDRSITAILCFIATLKVGAAYVPLSPEYPNERLEFMIKNTSIKLLFTNSINKSKFITYRGKTVFLDKEWDAILGMSNCQPEIKISPTDEAFIVFTSGTTGNPKGIKIPHRAIVNLVKKQNYIDLNQNDVIAHLSNINFDASTFEIWSSLLNSSTLHVIDKTTMQNPDQLAEKLQNCTMVFMTTALLNHMVKLAPQAFDKLKAIFFGGEAANTETLHALLNRKKQKNPKLKIINLYGPAENTTSSTYYIVEKLDTKALTVPIGKAINNNQVYIVDENLQPVPIGAPGELLVGGAGLAKEYVNLPDLTKEKFIINPFLDNKSKNNRLYKTGDIARWTWSGNIEFIGRADNQVKIRGFRIELGEIETKIRQHPAIINCALVVLEKNEQKQLVAYYVTESKGKVPPIALRDYLVQKLPDYMLPSFFVELQKIPLTPNGKVDFNKLPTPISKDDDERGREINTEHSDYNNLRGNIQSIWSDVLNNKQVSLTENFFHIGGNSLLALVLTKKLETFCKRSIPPSFIYLFNTIEKQAQQLGKIIFSPYCDLMDLNESASKNILVLIHPTGAGAEVYYKLAAAIGTEIKIIGINSYNINNPDKTTSDFNFIIQYYFDILWQKLKPNGKNFRLSLGGWSSGGNIALKLAQKFIERGIDIKKIFLLDSFNASQIRDLQSKHNWLERFQQAQIINAGVPKELQEYMQKINTMEMSGLKNLAYQPYLYSAILFKCSQSRPYNELIKLSEEEELEQKALNSSIMKIKHNGWNKTISKPKIIKTPSHHGNIVSSEESIQIIAKNIRIQLLK